MTITDFCDEVHNYFEVEKYIGHIVISDGELQNFSDRLQTNQYFRIVGSVFNDGVHEYPDNTLVNEQFDGAIWVMAVPPAALELLTKMQEWDIEYGNNADNYSPYASESYHHYSRTFSIYTSSSGDIKRPTWQSVFKRELNKWRKI